MNFIKGIFIFFSILFITSLLTIICSQGKEFRIQGVWQEVSWKYEKVDFDGHQQGFEISHEQIQEISKDLIIHEAETWSFQPGGTLILYAQGKQIEEVTWHLKNRGTLLELKHQNEKVEQYQIQEMTDDQLVLHFNSDIQVRGIVKLTFQRKNEPEDRYAKQI